jgi:hypothetical protein
MIGKRSYPSWPLRVLGYLLFVPFCLVAAVIATYTWLHPAWFDRRVRSILRTRRCAP